MLLRDRQSKKRKIAEVALGEGLNEGDSYVYGGIESLASRLRIDKTMLDETRSAVTIGADI
jgi:hypothetical protein